MTKNAVILLTAVCQLIFLNISTNLFVTAVQTTEAPKDETPPVTNSPLRSAGKGKLHPHNTIKSHPESSYHDYSTDDELYGGKSLAFLRLGRSSEEEPNTNNGLRKEIDEAIQCAGVQHKHHIKKRSNLPQGEDDGLDVDVPTMIDGNNNDEIKSPEILESRTISNPYGLSDTENEDEHDAKEKIENVPIEESAASWTPDFDTEEENDEVFDLDRSPYLSSHPDLYEKRNSFSLRPMKRNNFAFRPMKRNNFAFRPMKRNNFAFRPMKRNNFAFRPMKRNNFAFRPMKRNNFAFRPMKKNNFAFRPMKRGKSYFAGRFGKRNEDSFALRPVKKRGNNFAFRPMKKGNQRRKEDFLRYGKRDSFALRPMKREDSFAFRPMKRPGDSFALRPMKKYFSSVLGVPEKKGSFSLRPMKKGRARFQLRPMKRNSELNEGNDFWENFNFWRQWRPQDNYESLEDFTGLESLVKRGMSRYLGNL